MSGLGNITGNNRCVWVIECAPSKEHLQRYGYKEDYSRLSHDTDLTKTEALSMAKNLRARGTRCRVVRYVPVAPRRKP